MYFSILTLFPQMFQGPFDCSIIKRARDKNLITIDFIDIRDFASDRYKSVDGHPYGGGAGMILRVDVVDRAIQATVRKRKVSRSKTRIILMDPQGRTYTQAVAKNLLSFEHLVIICGHYEGVDERIRTMVDEEISVGDFIVSGGELPAMIVVDSVARLFRGVLKNSRAVSSESFWEPHLLEYPQYTEPRIYKGKEVPEVMVGGNHTKIAQWKEAQSKIVTKQKRNDLIRKNP
jgi:tRNA (guanine37-N1)-methyltransferase